MSDPWKFPQNNVFHSTTFSSSWESEPDDESSFRSEPLCLLLKRMQAASSRRNRGAAAEAKGEQQLKWMPQSGPGAAAEADASGEQQLAEADTIGEQLCSLHRELSGAGFRTVGERGGSS